MNTIISACNRNLSDWRTRPLLVLAPAIADAAARAGGLAVYLRSNTKSFPERKSVIQSLPSEAVFPFVRE